MNIKPMINTDAFGRIRITGSVGIHNGYVSIQRLADGTFDIRVDDNLHHDRKTIESLLELMYDRNKCILNMKSENGYVRTLSKLLIKNNLKYYKTITISNIWGNYSTDVYDKLGYEMDII
jgi:hypothetical protein